LGIGIKICQEDLGLVMIRDSYVPFYVKTTVLYHARFFDTLTLNFSWTEECFR